MNNEISLDQIMISPCETFHIYNNLPLYLKRFKKVLKFHTPGLAPVFSLDGAFHINIKGEPAYNERFLKSFGFYQGLAAVVDNDGWFHIKSDGSCLYDVRYLWCGNFQNNACVVCDKDNYYFHIDLQGQQLYREKYKYAGDFRDEIAVVQNEQGYYSHISRKGELLHNKWFLDLDVYHKGYARAKNEEGWLHINQQGEAIYPDRYIMIEPYYNGVARVETQYGEILRIDELGHVVQKLRNALRTPFQFLSADIVGYWKTQTIKAAVDLNIFAHLPSNLKILSNKIGLNESIAYRLLRALAELRLVKQVNNNYELTELSEYLTEQHERSLYHAVKHWAQAHYLAWMHLGESLQENKPSYEKVFKHPLFDWLDRDNNRLIQYQDAMDSYARHDYPDLIKKIDFSGFNSVIDAGGGKGALLQSVLNNNSHLTGILLERSAVVKNITIPDKLQLRMSAKEFDLFKPWPKRADSIILSRVLHDWNDDESVLILQNARDVLNKNGRIFVIEMLLNETSHNGGMLDMNMLVITGGKERTLTEYQNLANKVNLNFAELITCGNYTVMSFFE